MCQTQCGGSKKMNCVVKNWKTRMDSDSNDIATVFTGVAHG